jgi:hypothetical protein
MGELMKDRELSCVDCKHNQDITCNSQVPLGAKSAWSPIHFDRHYHKNKMLARANVCPRYEEAAKDSPKIKRIVYGDGVHDDTEAIQAYFNGEAELYYPDGEKFIFPGRSEAKHLITKPILITANWWEKIGR